MEESINKLSEALLTVGAGSNSKGDRDGQLASVRKIIEKVQREVDRCSHSRQPNLSSQDIRVMNQQSSSTELINSSQDTIKL